MPFFKVIISINIFLFHAPMVHKAENGAEALDFPLKGIKETEFGKNVLTSNKSVENLCVIDETQIGEKYSDLREYQKSNLRRACKAKLIKEKENSYFKLFTCKNEKLNSNLELTSSFFKVLEYLYENGTKEQGIFRRDGNKAISEEISTKIFKNNEIKCDKYSILDLASGIKGYIREHLNGYFNSDLLQKIFESIYAKKPLKTEKLCKYLLFTLSSIKYCGLLQLKKLMILVSENKEHTQIPFKSIINIFSLTMTPKEMIETAENVKCAGVFFNTLINLDMNDLGDAIDLIKS